MKLTIINNNIIIFYGISKKYCLITVKKIKMLRTKLYTLPYFIPTSTNNILYKYIITYSNITIMIIFLILIKQKIVN